MGWLGKAAVGVGALSALRVALRQYQREDLRGWSVMITGGSRGLGLELAREFISHGARVALLARSTDDLNRAREQLERTANEPTNVITVPCDVREDDDVRRAIAQVEQALGGIDVLVNAAGVIDVAPIEHLPEEDFDDSLATHFWGPFYLIRSVVERMRPGSRIVNISSIGGLVSIPHLLSYSTGKFALAGFSEGLHSELANRDIFVTTVYPGLMRTGSHVKARFRGKHEKEFAWFAAGSGNPAVSMDARRAAKKIVDACRRCQPFLILTPQARLLHLMRALAPNTTAHVMKAVVQLLPAPSTDDGDVKRKGWQSTSKAAPSILTKAADRAIPRNNELTEREQDAYDASD